MTKKTSDTTTQSAKPRAVATHTDDKDVDSALDLADLVTRPSMNAAAVMTEYGKPFGNLEVEALAAVLSVQIKEINGGDLHRAEAMLYAQAHALQSIFMNFSRRALNQDYQRHLESFMRMALKAQNQCRMTLETLATIKNPPVVFARQANINNGGQQQVNNGSPAPEADQRAPAAKPQSAPTELLEATDAQWLDTGAASATGRADPHLAPVGAVHRPAK